jgi:hypothetical protein
MYMYVARRRRKETFVYLWVIVTAIACGLALGLTMQIATLLK